MTRNRCLMVLGLGLLAAAALESSADAQTMVLGGYIGPNGYYDAYGRGYYRGVGGNRYSGYGEGPYGAGSGSSYQFSPKPYYNVFGNPINYGRYYHPFRYGYGTGTYGF